MSYPQYEDAQALSTRLAQAEQREATAHELRNQIAAENKRLFARTLELEQRAADAEKDAERYRFLRTHQYNGMLDFDEYCDPNSPQAVHFDRMVDAALAARSPEDAGR